MLLFLDSFAHYAIGDITEKWTSKDDTVATWSIDATAGRTGGPCLKRVATSNTAVPGYVGFAPLLSQDGVWTPTDSGVIGFAIKVDDVAGCNPTGLASGGVVDIMDGADRVLSMQITSSGTFRVVRFDAAGGSTNLGTSVQGLQSGTWHFLEARWLIHASAGTFGVWIDGTQVLNITGADTLSSIGGATGTWNAVRVLGPQSASSPLLIARIHDLYLCDLEGSANNDRLGDVTVDVIRPNGAGNTTGWASTGTNWSAVDDDSPDDDSTYNSATSADTKDTYQFENIPASATVLGLQVCGLSRKTSEGAASVAPVIRSGGADYQGVALGIATTSYAFLLWPYDVNPAGSPADAFSASEVNAAEFGIVKTV